MRPRGRASRIPRDLPWAIPGRPFRAARARTRGPRSILAPSCVPRLAGVAAKRPGVDQQEIEQGNSRVSGRNMRFAWLGEECNEPPRPRDTSGNVGSAAASERHGGLLLFYF